MLDVLDLALVRAAHARIRPFVARTPLVEHPHDGGAIFVKAESLQPIGAFKLRGAFSLMTTLAKDCPGVVAHSSGNHAQAVARAAKVLGLRAVVVMPEDAPALKRARTIADGAEVVTVSNDSDERARVAAEIARDRGFVPVPPYDHPLIAAGQGTLALEVLEDAPSIVRFYCPVSGGGLMAGCAVVLAALAPHVEIVGVEPADANDTQRSLAAKARTKIPPPQTIADGLRVRIPGERTWPVLAAHVRRVETVTDDELLDAMAFALSELRLVLEPSGAAALAVALREGRGPSAVVASGGNVDPEVLGAALARVKRSGP
jgi:threonine dehydratase